MHKTKFINRYKKHTTDLKTLDIIYRKFYGRYPEYRKNIGKMTQDEKEQELLFLTSLF